MAKMTSYAFALTKARPDFIGKFVKLTDKVLVLENPMVVEYMTDLSVAFNADFLPMGMAPRYDRAFFATIPIDNLLYYVTLNEDDKMVQEYLKQVSATPETVSEDQTSSTASTN